VKAGLTMRKVASPIRAGSGEVSVAQMVPLQKKQKVEQEKTSDVRDLIFPQALTTTHKSPTQARFRAL
jgi:hypothetical protein